MFFPGFLWYLKKLYTCICYNRVQTSANIIQNIHLLCTKEDGQQLYSKDGTVNSQLSDLHVRKNTKKKDVQKNHNTSMIYLI